MVSKTKNDKKLILKKENIEASNISNNMTYFV